MLSFMSSQSANLLWFQWSNLLYHLVSSSARPHQIVKGIFGILVQSKFKRMATTILTSNRVNSSAMAFQTFEKMATPHHQVQWLLPLVLCWLYANMPRDDNAREKQDNRFYNNFIWYMQAMFHPGVRSPRDCCAKGASSRVPEGMAEDYSGTEAVPLACQSEQFVCLRTCWLLDQGNEFPWFVWLHSYTMTFLVLTGFAKKCKSPSQNINCHLPCLVGCWRLLHSLFAGKSKGFVTFTNKFLQSRRSPFTDIILSPLTIQCSRLQEINHQT